MTCLRYPNEGCLSYVFLLCVVKIKPMLSKHIFMEQMNTLRLDRGESLPVELTVVHRGY